MSMNDGVFEIEESGIKIVQFAVASAPYRAWYLCPGGDHERPHLFDARVVGWAVIEYPGLSAIVPMVLHHGEHELEPANASDNFLCAEEILKPLDTIEEEYREEIALLKDRLASEDTPLVYRPHFSNN